MHDHDAGSDDLVGLSVLVKGAQSGPFSELLSVGNANEMRAVFGTQSLHQLDVVAMIARLGQEAKEALTSIQNATRLAQTAVQRVGEQSLLQGLLDGIIKLESLKTGTKKK